MPIQMTVKMDEKLLGSQRLLKYDLWVFFSKLWLRELLDNGRNSLIQGFHTGKKFVARDTRAENSFARSRA